MIPFQSAYDSYAELPNYNYNQQSGFSIFSDDMMIYLGVLFVAVMVYRMIKTKPELSGHWNTLIQGASYSTKNFYDQLEVELKKQDISSISYSRINKTTKGLAFKSRLYMKVKWRNSTFDICAAPFGNSFFVSYWAQENLTPAQEIMNAIPFIGKFLLRTFARVTYYSIDTSHMFNTLLHQSVLTVTDNITDAKEIERIPELDRRPINKDIFKR